MGQGNKAMRMFMHVCVHACTCSCVCCVGDLFEILYHCLRELWSNKCVSRKTCPLYLIRTYFMTRLQHLGSRKTDALRQLRV